MSHAISRLNRQLQIRRVVPAGVHDMPALVLRAVFAEGGHPLAKQILRADDQPKLLARTEHQTGNRSISTSTTEPGASFSTRSKLWTGTSSVESVSSRARLLEGLGTGRVDDPIQRCGRGWHRQCWSVSWWADDSSGFQLSPRQTPKRWWRWSRRLSSGC